MFAPETFIVRAVDDGMAPRIGAGDHVCVDPDKPAADGSVVLFGRGSDAVVRRLVVQPDGRPAHASQLDANRRLRHDWAASAAERLVWPAGEQGS